MKNITVLLLTLIMMVTNVIAIADSITIDFSTINTDDSSDNHQSSISIDNEQIKRFSTTKSRHFSGENHALCKAFQPCKDHLNWTSVARDMTVLLSC